MVTRKRLEIETPLERTTSRKWPMGNWMVTYDRWRHVTLKGEVVTPIHLKPMYLENNWRVEMLFSNNRQLLDSLQWGSTVTLLATAWLLVPNVSYS